MRRRATVLVRVHSHCLAGDVFGATTLRLPRSCCEPRSNALPQAGRGALIYLHNTSRGFDIDRARPRRACLLHRETRAAVHPDPGHEERHQRMLRQVGLGGQILADLGIRKIRLSHNTPTHVPALQGFDIEIVEQVPIVDGAHVP